MAIKHTTTQDKGLSLVRALVYGDSGIGKTTSLNTLPEKQTAIVALERGLLPLRRSNFPVLSIDSWNDVRDIVRMFREPQTLGGHEIKILAVDSVTEISEMCKRHIIEVERKALVSERTKGKSDKPTGIYDDMMTMEDWGAYGAKMMACISAFVHLPLHVVFTGLAAWKEDKQTGQQLRTIGVGGSLAQAIPAFFDLVLHMEASTDTEGNPVRVWRTATDGRVYAKDASGDLAMFEPANWTTLFRKIMAPRAEKIAA